MNKWEPKGGIDAFKERCIEARGIGKTWAAICKEEGCSRNTLWLFFKQHQDIKKEIEEKGEEEALENLRQTAMEVAIVEKKPAIIIFLLKAKLGYKDGSEYQPPRAKEEADKDPLVRPITAEEARKILEERRKQDVSSTG